MSITMIVHTIPAQNRMLEHLFTKNMRAKASTRQKRTPTSVENHESMISATQLASVPIPD